MSNGHDYVSVVTLLQNAGLIINMRSEIAGYHKDVAARGKIHAVAAATLRMAGTRRR